MNTIKFIIFIIIGIILFFILNYKEAFNIGCPPHLEYADFDPSTNPLFNTRPIMQDQNLSRSERRLKNDLNEYLRTKTINFISFDTYVQDIGILSVCKKLKNIRTTTGPNRVCLWIGLGYLQYLNNEYLDEEIIIVCDISLQALKFAQDSVKIHQALYPDSNKKFLFYHLNLIDITEVTLLLDIININGFIVSIFNISNVLDYYESDIDNVRRLVELFNTHEGVSDDMHWIINSRSSFTWFIHKADAVVLNSNSGLSERVYSSGTYIDYPSGIFTKIEYINRLVKEDMRHLEPYVAIKLFLKRISKQLNKDIKILTSIHSSYYDNELIFFTLQREVHSLGNVTKDEFLTNSEPGSESTLIINKNHLYNKLLLEEQSRYYNNCLETWFNGNPIHGLFFEMYDRLIEEISDTSIKDILRLLKPFYVYNQREISYLADREVLDRELLVEFILNPPSCFYVYSDTTLHELLNERLEFNLWRKRPGRFETGYNSRRFVLQNDKLSRYDGDTHKGDIMLTSITRLNIIVEGRFHYLIIEVGDETFKLWAGEYNTFTQSNEDLSTLQKIQTRLQAQLLLLELSSTNNPNFRLITSYEGKEYTRLKTVLKDIDLNVCSA